MKGFVITHGHEDHIGALPYVLKELNVPVYATKLTMGIIENKLTEHNLIHNVRRKVVKFGQNINLGCFRIEFIKTNHSIVDAAALAIYSPAGIVVHTGDFKVDYTPVYGDAIDLQRFAELGKKGVLALMCDSTNAERQGFTPSEKLGPVLICCLRNIKRPESSLRPLRPMWTGYSRLSTPQINSAERWWLREEAW